jgi:hypothetical protein
MKSSPIKLIAVLVACAASGAGGYWYGQNGSAKSASKNSAKAPAARWSQSIFAPGQSGATLSWQDLLKAKGKMNADTLAAWAKNLSPEELAAALNGLKGQPANSQRNDLMGALYNAWAERDPQGFLGGLGDITVPRLREGGVDAALKAMAASDPKAALQWIKDNPGTASTSAEQQRFAAAIAGYAATDPAGALAAINALGTASPQDRQMVSAATQALATTLTDQGQYSQAADLFNQLPAGQTRTDAYSQLAQQWAESSPQDAANWISTLNGDPALKASASVQVAKAWAANDPAAAATWAAQQDLQNADPNSTTPNGQLLASAIQSWAGYDLDGPGQFLNQLPASPTKDSSVAIFAMSSTSEDPQSAMQWVNTISNDQTRQGATIGVALQWMQQDPASFNAYLSTSTTLSDQQKQMLSNIPPQMVQRMGQFNTMMGGGNAVQTIMENMLINGGGPGGGGFGGGGFGGQGGQGGAAGGGNFGGRGGAPAGNGQ